MKVSYSDIALFLRCRRQWWHHSVAERESPLLQWDFLLGSAIHAGLEAHFHGASMGVAVVEWWRDTYTLLSRQRTFTPEENLKYREQIDLSREMAHAYEAWAVYHDATLRVLAIEYHFEVPLPGTTDTLEGVIDGIVERDGDIWLLEHKTRTNFDDIEVLNLDLQTTLYQWALTHVIRTGQFPGVAPDTEVRGVLYTMLKKSVIEEPKLIRNGTALSQDKSTPMTYETFRATLQRTGFDPAPYEGTLQRLLLQAHPLIRRFEMERTETELRIALADVVRICQEMKRAREEYTLCYPTPTASCRWCSFFTPCTIERRGGDSTQDLQRYPKRLGRSEQRALRASLPTTGTL